MGALTNGTWEELPFYRLRDNIGRVVNPVNGDIYVFGGITVPSPHDGEGVFNDLWCYNRTSDGWTRLSDGDPGITRRAEAALAFDAEAGIIYMSGGRTSASPYGLNDLWAFDLEESTWTSLSSDIGVCLVEMGVMDGNLYGIGPLGTYPMRLVVYNISTGQLDVYNTILQTTPLKFGAGVTFDRSSGRFYIFGGFEYVNDEYHVLRALCTLNVRTRLVQELIPFPGPGRAFMDLAYSSNEEGFYMYGGTEERINANAYDHDDLWLYGSANDTWTMLRDGAEPGDFNDHRLMYDPVNRTLYIHWMYVYAKYNAFWALSIPDMQWHEKPPPLSPLPFIFGSVVALGDRIVMTAGKEPSGITSRGERMDYSIAIGEWIDMSRYYEFRGHYLATTAHDVIGDSAFAFGGFTRPSSCSFNLWSITSGSKSWRYLEPGNDPPRLSNGTMAYSEQDDSLYLFGGRNMTTGELSADLWRFDLGDAKWVLMGTGGPSAREHSTMVYDRDGILVLFAGWDGTDALNDLWTYNVSTKAWSETPEHGSWPVPRYHLAADCVPLLHRMMIFGGMSGSGSRLGDMWSYSVRTGNWTPVITTNTPPARYGHALTMSLGTGELYLIGGLESDNSLWRLSVITDPIVITPRPKEVNAKEDEPLRLEFGTANWPSAQWTVEKEAPWLVWNETDRSLGGVPRNGNVGATWVTVRASVDPDIYDEVRFKVMVENVPPVILPFDPGQATEDVEFRLELASDDDGQGNTSWSLGPTPPAWLAIDGMSGSLKGVPDNDEVGWYNVTVTVDDGNGGRTSTTFELEVLNVNDAPTIVTPDVLEARQGEAYEVDYDAGDIDPTHDMLVWSLETEADFLTIDTGTGVLSGTPGIDRAGKFLVRVCVKDGNGGQDESQFTMTVHEDPPAIISIDAQPIERPITIQIMEGEERWLTAEVRDEDPSTLLYSLSSDLHGSTVSGEGTIHLITAQGDAGEYLMVLTVTDRWGGSDEVMFKVVVIDVNDAPRFSPQPPRSDVADEDSQFTLQLHAFDTEGDTITWTDDTDLFDIDPSTGEIAFTPAQHDVGDHDVLIVADDGRGGRATSTITFSVRNVNDAPVIDRLEPSSGTTIDEGELVHLIGIVTDEDGDVLTYTWMDGGKVLGTGQGLDCTDLSDGDHTIRLVVTDGNASASQEIVVHVLPPVRTLSGMTLAWLLVLVIVVSVVCLGVWRWRKGH